MTKKQYILSFAAAALTAVLLTGCSGDSASSIEPEPQDTKTGIKINADVWRVMEGTRATTYDNQTALQTEGSFTCGVYTENTTTAYVSPTTVNWSSTEWLFSDGKHYWPSSGNLDFFAYMPTTSQSCITGPTYTTARSPQIVCANLPMTYSSATPSAGQGGLKEFIWALTTGQNKASQGSTGVTMTFKRPFARIKFQLAASHPDITINSITFKSLKTGGTCTFNGTTSTWSSLTPAESTSNFVMTLTGDAATFNNNPASVVPIGGYAESAHQSVNILMVPQAFAGAIEVNITWNNWGELKTETLSTSVPTTWQAGYSYTYTFTIDKQALKVDIEKFTEQW